VEKPVSLLTLYTDIELPLLPVLGDMELAGTRLDEDYLGRLEVEMLVALDEDYRKLQAVSWEGINPRSYPQMSELFYDYLGEPVLRWTKTGLSSTDKYALGMMSNEVAEFVLAYKETATALSSFVQKLPRMVLDDGRIHGSFNQAGTWEEHGGEHHGSPATGRLSSSGPNMQQISTRGRWGQSIRKAFIPADGFVFVGGDIGQEELRVAALLADCRRLLDGFSDPAFDPHRLTADLVGIESRDVAKNCNYALIYKVGVPKLFAMVPSLGTTQEAARVRREFFAGYPEFPVWWEKEIAACKEKLYAETWFHRRRYLPNILARGKSLHEAEREAINMHVQGTGADVIKIALRRIYDQLDGMESRIVLSSHDDVVIEAKKEELDRVCIIVVEMTKGLLPVDLPVEVKVGPNWGEMEKVNA
jgi:DNA polymerase-1